MAQRLNNIKIKPRAIGSTNLFREASDKVLLAQECSEKKERYDTCFIKWYSESTIPSKGGGRVLKLGDDDADEGTRVSARRVTDRRMRRAV